MRRLLRILFAGLVAVSLLVFVAAAGVWARSHFVADLFAERGSGRLWTVSVAQGEFAMTRSDRPRLPSLSDGESARVHRTFPPGHGGIGPGQVGAERWDWECFGARVASRGDVGSRARVIAIHLALPTALCSVAPVAWLVRSRRRAAPARAGA